MFNTGRWPEAGCPDQWSLWVTFTQTPGFPDNACYGPTWLDSAMWFHQEQWPGPQKGDSKWWVWDGIEQALGTGCLNGPWKSPLLFFSGSIPFPVLLLNNSVAIQWGSSGTSPTKNKPAKGNTEYYSMRSKAPAQVHYSHLPSWICVPKNKNQKTETSANTPLHILSLSLTELTLWFHICRGRICKNSLKST